MVFSAFSLRLMGLGIYSFTSVLWSPQQPFCDDVSKCGICVVSEVSPLAAFPFWESWNRFWCLHNVPRYKTTAQKKRLIDSYGVRFLNKIWKVVIVKSVWQTFRYLMYFMVYKIYKRHFIKKTTYYAKNGQTEIIFRVVCVEI